MLVKTTSSVEARFQTAYIRRRGKTRHVPLQKQEMFEEQANKQVSPKERDNSRNTTDVPTYVMFPACVNKVYTATKQKF